MQHSGVQVFLKCENLQRVGAFKFRGAMNALLLLGEGQRAAGVVTHSSGNHAQALALAGQLLGVPVTIVMPRTAPAVKRAATEGYGARIVPCEPTLESRESTVAAEIQRHGLTLVHPYNDWNVIAGQGTAALELLDQAGPLDAVIAPVGGGGLLSGTALAVKGRSPGTSVMGAEPAAADDAYRSLKAGAIQPSLDPRTIADGPAHLVGKQDLRRDLTACRRDLHGLRGRDHCCDPVRLGAHQDRHRAIERRRRRAAAGRPALTARPPRRDHPQRRQRRR